MKHRNITFIIMITLVLLLCLDVIYWHGIERFIDATLEIEDGTRPSYLMVGTNVWPGYEPFYLARELGFFEDANIRLVEYSSSTQTIRSLRNGAIQAAALTLDEVLMLWEKGSQLRVILVTDISDGGDMIITKPEVKNLQDLRGRRVGAENTAVGAYLLTRALQKAGLEPKDLTVVPLEIDEQEQEFLKGTLDAVVTFEPVGSRLLNAGGQKLFDSSQIPNEIIDVLVVHQDVLQDQKEEVNVLLRAWFRALEYLKSHPLESARHMSGRLKITPPEILSAYEGIKLPDLEENIRMMTGDPPPLEVNIQRLAEVEKKTGLLERNIDPKGLLDPSPLHGLKAGESERNK